MRAKHLTNLVTLPLALDDLGWLRNFLKEERLAAEIDHEEVERLNTDVAIRAAKIALNSEIARLAKVIDALDVAIAADVVREAIAKRIDATVPGMPDISNTHPPLSKEMEL